MPPKDMPDMLQNFIETKEAAGETIENAPVLTEEEKMEMDEGNHLEKDIEEDEGLYSVTNFTV